MLYLENGAFTGRLLGSRYFWLVSIVLRHHTLREACTAEYHSGRIMLHEEQWRTQRNCLENTYLRGNITALSIYWKNSLKQYYTDNYPQSIVGGKGNERRPKEKRLFFYHKGARYTWSCVNYLELLALRECIGGLVSMLSWKRDTQA